VKAVIVLIIAAFSVIAQAETESSFMLPSGVTIKITESHFDKKLFKVKGCIESATICRINGHAPIGTAFGLPKTYVKSIVAKYQDKSYSLDVSDMYDAWGERPLEYKGSIRYFGGKCFDLQNCQFRGLFSDGGGAFVAEWRVVNGLMFRTVLSDSNDIVNLFTKNIDPPEFN
jgi:hypothetical protein